jgi:hypothetical protein
MVAVPHHVSPPFPARFAAVAKISAVNMPFGIVDNTCFPAKVKGWKKRKG